MELDEFLKDSIGKMDESKILHLHRTEPQVKVKLSRGQKGGVGWEVSCSGDNFEEVIRDVLDAHKKLKEIFESGEDEY